MVVVAREVRAGASSPGEFDKAFASALVYAQNPESGGLMVSEVPGKGSWVPVFSTLERLARFAGNGEYQELRGGELLAHLPAGLGVVFDIQDTHMLPLLPRADGTARFGDDHSGDAGGH